FDRARLHHRRHAVGPSNVLFLENLDHVDVDEVNAKLLAGDAVAAHLFDDGVGEFRYLLRCRWPGRAFDPGEGMPDVFLWQPRNMSFDLKADVALLEQYRAAVAA